MTTCFAVVRGKRLRLTELNDCGEVVSGALFVVSKGFIQVALTSELEAGDEYIQKNADGELCINERAPDNLKRLNVTVDWCEVDPDALSIATGYPQEIGSSPGDSVGIRINEGIQDARWALEVWTGLGGNKCGPLGQRYGYMLLPQVTGSALGDVTVGNQTTTFQTTGYTEGFSGWGVGPYDVIGTPSAPTPLLVPIGDTTHALLRVTDVPPPDVVCGAQIFTSPSS